MQLHSKKRNRLEQKKLNDLVYIKYNRALRRRYDARDTIDPIILDDASGVDPNEWLQEALGNDEDSLVHEGEDLTWGDVANASGANEAPYSTRNSQRSQAKGGKKSTPSTSKAKGKASIVVEEDDEEESASEEEMDPAAYKDDDDECEDDDLDY